MANNIEEKFIGDYVNGLQAATDDEVKNGVVMVRTASGEMKKAEGDKLGGASIVTVTYNVSSYADVKAAIDAGNVVECNYNYKKFRVVDVTGSAIRFGAIVDANTSGSGLNSYSLLLDAGNTWSYKEKSVATQDQLPTVPTKTSELTNDSGFVTDAVSDNKQYARKNGAWVEVSGGSSDYEKFKKITFYANYTENTPTYTTSGIYNIRSKFTRNDGFLTIGHANVIDKVNFANFQNFEIKITYYPLDYQDQGVNVNHALFSGLGVNYQTPSVQLNESVLLLLYPNLSCNSWIRKDIAIPNLAPINEWVSFRYVKEGNVISLYRATPSTNEYLLTSMIVQDGEYSFEEVPFAWGQNFDKSAKLDGYIDFKRTYIKNNGSLVWGCDISGFDV